MMAFLILLIIFILLGIKPISTTDGSWEASAASERISFEDHQEEMMMMMQLRVVSGQDESEKKEALLLDKFRVLLGLGSLHKKNHGAMELYGSPAPAPAPSTMEAQAPSPAPILQPIPLHPHRRHPPHLKLPRHQIHGHNEKQRARRRILVGVLVSIGAALLIFGVGFLCFVKKYYKRRKRYVRTVSVVSIERGKDLQDNGANNNKVKNDPPSFDLFYLNTLASVLEPETHFKESSSSGKVDNVEDHSQDYGVRGISNSVEEIVSIQEHEEEINHHCDDRISRIESRSSGDESFHSLCESNASNNARLSNASMSSSFSDAVEGFSPKVSNAPSTQNPTIQTQPTQDAINSKEHSKHPPPSPPPPPPPPPVHCSPLVKLKAKSPSSILQTPSSSESSSSRSNEIIASPKAPIPPKPPSNIPPPPCPPLYMKGNSLKNPPPPPPPDFANLGKDGAPLPKLKPLHWDKVRATPDRSMVWDKLRSSSFEFDEEMIESLFGYSLKNVFQNDEGKSKTPSPNKHVLEPKRLQNMTILSKALNVTVEQVCEALVQGDGLRLQQLEALAKMEPTKEEETKLSNYKGNINELGSAEKLVKAMLNIPFAFQRIEAMLYRATFEDEVVHLRNSFSMLEEACKELRSSRLFLKLLEAVLKTGNRMNVGTIRGGAKAFKLDALLKLADVKGTDGKTTLLHFVVLEIIKSEGIKMADSIMGKIHRTNKTRTTEEKEEDYKKMGLDLVSGLTTELCNVKKTAAIDLDILATSVSNLSDGMTKLHKLVLKDLSKDGTSGNFIGVMKIFIGHAEESLREVQEHEAKVSKSVKEITEYFHGEVGKDESNLLHIFVIVRDFLAMLDQVCRELKSSKGPKTPNTLAPFH